MKKALLTLGVLAFVISFVSIATASELPKPVEKFTKGAVDVAKSPLIVYDHTKFMYDSTDSKPIGLVKGLIESPFHLFKKAGGGAIDMVTFPIE